LSYYNVLEDFFAQSLAGMAGFRNILVPGQQSIERVIVYDQLKRLDDFRSFQKQVLEYLNKPSSPPSN